MLESPEMLESPARSQAERARRITRVRATVAAYNWGGWKRS